MTTFQLLHRLPEELRFDILERLGKTDLTFFGETSRWTYDLATPLIWRDVELVDCRTQHEESVDEHDDTPLLKKLLVLAKNPRIAACVQRLTHRCHLPPPSIFNELPDMPFSSQTLSCDPRTTKLVQLAVQHMTRVQTLRIILGHPNMTDALLRCFFDRSRRCETSIRRLWLENCRISAGCTLRILDHPLQLPLELDFSGLEAMRFRRLPLRAMDPTTSLSAQLDDMGPFRSCEAHSRRGYHTQLQDGVGGHYETVVVSVPHELYNAALDDEQSAQERTLVLYPSSPLYATNMPRPGDEDDRYSFEKVLSRWDDRIYNDLNQLLDLPLELNDSHVPSRVEKYRLSNRGPWLDPPATPEIMQHKAQREKQPSANAMLGLLRSASTTLTSLCLDWVFTVPADSKSNIPGERPQATWSAIFCELFSLRFPNLRAFQLRNAVVQATSLPAGVYLFDKPRIITGPSDSDQTTSVHSSWPFELDCLAFMEAHSALQCLAWPMESFFPDEVLPTEIITRADAVIENLRGTLIDLRVDTLYSGSGEPRSDDNDRDCVDLSARARRRMFISRFASHMTKLESIKIEGGVPRDERREIIRALHACPLQKIVMIGVSSPTGNTWGQDGCDLPERLTADEREHLDAEDKEPTFDLGFRAPQSPPHTFTFEPTYSWPRHSPPLLHTIASFHAQTVTELKFCGYKGAPVLFYPTAITTPLLAALSHFHALQTLIMSFWLPTTFEGLRVDSEIIQYWLSTRPTSKSLIPSPSAAANHAPSTWETLLREKFSPAALSAEVTKLLSPLLSDEAKGRKNGVHVRASFCVGDWGGIFDLDLRIGRDGGLGFTGPREEGERERRRGKLEGRRWF